MPKTQYAPVVTFVEEMEDYRTVLALIDAGNYNAAVEYMSQWEMADRLDPKSWVDSIPDSHGLASHSDDFYSYNLLSWDTPKGMQMFAGTVTLWRIHELGCIRPDCNDAPHWED